MLIFLFKADEIIFVEESQVGLLDIIHSNEKTKNTKYLAQVKLIYLKKSKGVGNTSLLWLYLWNGKEGEDVGNLDTSYWCWLLKFVSLYLVSHKPLDNVIQ